MVNPAMNTFTLADEETETLTKVEGKNAGVQDISREGYRITTTTTTGARRGSENVKSSNEHIHTRRRRKGDPQ